MTKANRSKTGVQKCLELRQLCTRKSVTRSWLVASVFILLASSLLPACGPGFELRKKDGSFESETPQAAMKRLNWREVPGTEFANSLLGQQALGYLPVLKGASPETRSDRYYQFDLKVDFDSAFRPLSQIVQQMSKNICSQAPAGILRGSGYMPGELPCGEIVDGNWKKLAQFDVPAIDGEAGGGFDFHLFPFTVPVHISRRPLRGEYVEANLDTRTQARLFTSPEFGRDVSLRYRPYGDHAMVDICTNVPGAEITVPKRRVSVQLKRRILGIRTSATVDFDVTLGTASFNFLRSCVSAKISYDTQARRLRFEPQEIQYPQMSEVRWEGMRIEIKTAWLRVLDSIARAFRFNFRQKLINSMQGRFAEMAESEIENGHWLMRLKQKAITDKLVESIGASAAQTVATDGTSVVPEQLRERLSKQCRAFSFLQGVGASTASGVASGLSARFQETCLRLIRDADLKIAPFYRLDESAQLGCFDSFGNIHSARDSSGQKKWWAQACKFAIRVQIRVPQAQDAFVKDLKQLLATFDSGLPIPEDLRRLLAAKKLGDEAVHKIVAELEKRGMPNASWRDIQNNSALLRSLLNI